MRKLFAVILAALLVTSLLTVGVFAASTRTFEEDEWDSVKNSFTAEIFDGRGLRAVRSPSAGLGKDAFINAYLDGYNDEPSSYVDWSNKGIGEVKDKEGNVLYNVFTKSDFFLRYTGMSQMIGGNWISGAGSVPFNRLPFNIDVDLNGKRDISGVRIYAEKNPNNAGYVTKYEVYVNYSGADDDWHCICSGTNNQKADVTADFGYNITASKVRISITEISNKTGAAITSTDGTKTIPAGAPTYLFLDGVTVLNKKEGYKNATVEQKDDEITIDASKLAGSASAKQLMDGYSDKSVSLNGTNLDFGEQITFSGFRYYPPAGATEKVAPYSFNQDAGVTLYSTVNSETGNLDGAQSMKSLLYEDYTDYNSDPSKPITVYFKRNITARGIRFHIWHTVEKGVGDGTAAAPYAGEIRLIAAREGYPDMSNVVEFKQTPTVIDHGATKEGVGFVWWNPSCLFDKYIYTKDGEFGKNATNDGDYYVGFGTYGKDAGFTSGEKAWLTIDLKEQTEFSAVRLFGRMKFKMSPTDVNLYFSDDNVNWTLASHNTDSMNGKQIDDMFCYSSTGSIYTDMTPNNGENDYSIKARYIKIEILKAAGSDYATLSEIMLVKPGAEVLTCDALNEKILKNSVKTAIKTVQSGVLDGTERGIIRFITEFIKVGAEVEYFGTYAIGDAGAPNFGETSGASVNTAVYDVGKDGLSQPVAGNTYSVDITDIPSTKFDVPVYAVSFVKIKGYDNLILSEAKTGVTVDKDMNLKTAVTAEDGE